MRCSNSQLYSITLGTGPIVGSRRLLQTLTYAVCVNPRPKFVQINDDRLLQTEDCWDRSLFDLARPKIPKLARFAGTRDGAGKLNPDWTGPMKELHRWLQEILAGTPRSDFLLAVASGLIAWTIVLFLHAAVG
jgi:hypothetical protein